MPFKNPQAYREYMRCYRRRQRERKPGGKPDGPAPELVLKADPEHVRRLQQAVGQAVATPRGRGILLHVSEDYSTVAIAGVAVAFPCERVGLW